MIYRGRYTRMGIGTSNKEQEMKADMKEICDVITEHAGEALVEEHGHAEAMRLCFEERDRLGRLDEAINQASAALTEDTTVNHLHKLTGIEVLMVERYGVEAIKTHGLVEVLKELIESHDQMAGESVTIMGETFEIGPEFNAIIRKTIEIGDVVKTVEVTFGDPADEVADSPVELKGEKLATVGRIVLYVDENHESLPAIVTKVHDGDIVSIHVFPVRSASYPITAVQYSYGPMVNTWHWPNDQV